MSNYQLIALDMDGTLLNLNKEVLKSSISAIEKAVKSGKIVILNTGRCPAELEEYKNSLQMIQYYNCISGAYIYDTYNGNCIYSKPIEPKTVKSIIQIARKNDIMVHLLGATVSVVQKAYLDKMEHYMMGTYRNMFERVTQQWNDMYVDYEKNKTDIYKINLYHTSTLKRLETQKLLSEHGIEIETAFSEIASLEISAKGVNKGSGLLNLCKYLGISISETVVVGDSYNDLDAFKAGGLAVAMGNSNDEIKKAADVVVNDCDCGGCAEAIEKYLL